jgi:hypothetical protein
MYCWSLLTRLKRFCGLLLFDYPTELLLQCPSVNHAKWISDLVSDVN